MPGFVYEKSGVKAVIGSGTTHKIFREATNFLDKDLYAISKRITKRVEHNLKRSKSRRSK